MMAKKTESPKSYIKSAKKKNSVLENLLSYFLTIALSFLFALFCSWRVGIFLLLLLLLSPLLSFLLILLMRPMIAVEMQLSKPVAAKKERLRISMSLRNRFPFPTPGIVIEILKNPCVIYESLAYEVAIMPFSSVSVSIPVLWVWQNIIIWDIQHLRFILFSLCLVPFFHFSELFKLFNRRITRRICTFLISGNKFFYRRRKNSERNLLSERKYAGQQDKNKFL